MNRIYAIAINAYREAIRDRVLIGVLAIAAMSLFLGLALGWLSVGEQQRILTDHGIVTISLLSNLIAVFLGASFLYKEIELRTLYIILAKPLSRWEFVLGKYFGIVVTTVMFVLLTSSLLLVLIDLQVAEQIDPVNSTRVWFSRVVRSSRGMRLLAIVVLALLTTVLSLFATRSNALGAVRDRMGAAVTVLWGVIILGATAALVFPVAPEATRYVLLSNVLIIGEVLLTAAIALFFSSFSTPFVTGMLTLGMFSVGRSAGFMLEIHGKQLPPEVQQILKAVASVVPNLHLFVPSRQTLMPTAEASGVSAFMINTLSYGTLYAVLLLIVAMAVFRRRDLL